MRAGQIVSKGGFQRTVFQFKSLLENWWGFAAAGAFAALVGQGFFRDISEPGADPVRLVATILLSSLLAARLVGRLRETHWSLSEEPGGVEGRFVRRARDVELGLLLVVTGHAVLQLTGGLSSPLYPMMYALAAALVAAHGVFVGGLVVASSVVLEGLAARAAGVGLADRVVATHAAFTIFFAAVGLVFLRAEIRRLRRQYRARLDEELERRLREAADYRLIGASLGSHSEEDRQAQLERLWYGSVEAIHESLFSILDLVKRSLGLQTCALLWSEDGSGRRVSLRELVSDSDLVSDRRSGLRSGVAGGVFRTGSPLHLCPVRQPVGAFAYYGGPETVGSFLAVPVREGGRVRGVLCCDRRHPEAFSRRDVQIAERAAEQVARTIQAERLFCSVERSKYEQERFFRASEMLNRAFGLDQVLQTAFEAARQIVQFDAGAVTLFEEKTKRHRVAAVFGAVPKEWEGLEFGDDNSLVAMAIRARHELPAGGRAKGRQYVCSTKHPLKGMASLLVLPLIGGDKVVGAFVLAAEEPGLFSTDRRGMLRVIGHQVAVAIQNAVMLRRLEEMATTDGLTGLLNHRTFQEKLDEMLARAQRSGRPLAMVLTDIDHFKSVNDTYGHPVGDKVLAGVARVLARCVRTVDVVARYGGEEFAIVLEETDGQGAVQLAERIRQEVSKLRFDSEQGPFQVTLSLGVAVYPEHGRAKKVLIDHADQALYRAKESGRNRVVFYGDL